MIRAIDFPSEVLRAGEPYTLRIVAPDPITVEIRCFVETPPPKGYRPCPECGSIHARSGQVLHLRVSEVSFHSSGGALEIFIQDADGDSRRIRLQVSGRGEDRGTPMISGEYA